MFTIRPRRIWGAAEPLHRTLDSWQDGCTVVVHHTAGHAPKNSELAERAEMRAIQRLHVAGRGWSDIGYNYVIMPSGRVYEGRGYNVVGAHTADHNTGTIGISFAGNYDTSRPSLRSLLAYRLLVRRLKQHGAHIRATKGHRQMPGQSTACPGRHLMRALGL